MIVKRCVLAFLFLALGGASMVAAEGAKAVEDTLRAVPTWAAHLQVQIGGLLHEYPQETSAAPSGLTR
jgi:hypothetical protein